MKITKLLILVLTFVICLSFCACAESEKNSTDDGIYSETVKKTPSRFTVTVQDQDGNLIEGVILKIKSNSAVTARSNNKGVATFPVLPTVGYKLSVVSCPDGYEYIGPQYIPIQKNQFELVLEITKK